MRSALRPVFSSWIEIYCVWVWGVLFKFQPFSEGACIVRTSRLQLNDECRGFFNVWSCQNWLSNTHTHLVRRCVWSNAIGWNKKVEVPTSVEVIRDTTVRSLTWKRRVFVLTPRVKLKHLRQPNVLFISHLYVNLPFQFSFLSHRFGHYSSHSKDFFDIVSSFVGFSIKMCCFHSVDLMADGQEAVLPSQSFLWAVPSMFLDQRHTKLIR